MISFKKLVYNIIKFPLILIFIKTPLINILKKRFKFHRYLKERNIIWVILDALFQREYFNKLKDKNEMRELTDSTLIDGEGKKWAENYYNGHFKTLEELKRRKQGIMSCNESQPIFSKIINYIRINKIDENDNVYIIQLGSSSGRDLEFFYNLFPKLNYISTDVNDEILDFQKEKYNYSNFKYYKCYAEDIDECINHFQIYDKKIILFSSGSLQYVNPFFLKEFFSKIKKYKNLNLFLNENISLRFIEYKNNLISYSRSNISFSHRYDEYAKNSGTNIIENKIIRLYLKDDKQHWDTGHFYLHTSN